jgi:hypothetical protein
MPQFGVHMYQEIGAVPAAYPSLTQWHSRLIIMVELPTKETRQVEAPQRYEFGFRDEPCFG